VEVRSNKGETTYMLSEKIVKHGKVVAAEPDHVSFAFVRNVAWNRKNVLANNIACRNYKGFVSIRTLGLPILQLEFEFCSLYLPKESEYGVFYSYNINLPLYHSLFENVNKISVTPIYLV